MSDQLKMHSPNLVDANIEKIAVLFPNCITETQDENGELKKAIDFDLLKQELSQVIVEGEQERYRLDWVGKKESILTANAPIAKTLRPCREESLNFDTTENLFIEGDNLEALKLLQENYLGKVKMIYIDPPYNTGNDFIYEDDFAESTDEFFERSNQIDDEGNKLVANTDSNGRFHSDWLSMLYSRLKLARNLLKEDGVIFVSIDDNELETLKIIMAETFGEKNFIAQIIHKGNALKNQAKFIGVSTEYILVFAKDLDYLSKSLGSDGWKENKAGAKEVCSFVNKCFKKGMSLEETLEEVKDLFSRPKFSHLSRWNKLDLNGLFMDDNLSRDGGYKNFTIINPNTNQPCPIPPRGWAKSEAELKKLQEQDLIWYGSGDTPPRLKSYLTPDILSVPDNFKYFDSSKDKKLIDSLFNAKVFEFPKPVDLLKNLIEICCRNNEINIVLDFFAGSASTAHAVMEKQLDNFNLRYILVQIPENTDIKSDAYNAGYKTIAEISKERIRLAGKKILEDNADKEGIENLDVGFRVLKIDSTNMKDVYYTPDAYKQVDILDLADHIKEDRTSEDLLFQVMLDWGLELSLPIEQKIIQGKEVFYVAGNSLVACFDEINFAMVDEIAQDKPLRVVSAERAIQLDHDKTNIKERFKQLSPETEVKFI